MPKTAPHLTKEARRLRLPDDGKKATGARRSGRFAPQDVLRRSKKTATY